MAVLGICTHASWVLLTFYGCVCSWCICMWYLCCKGYTGGFSCLMPRSKLPFCASHDWISPQVGDTARFELINPGLMNWPPRLGLFYIWAQFKCGASPSCWRCQIPPAWLGGAIPYMRARAMPVLYCIDCYWRHHRPPRMPTWAMSGSQGGAQPGSPGVRAPRLLSGPGPPPTGGTAPRRAATGQFGCSRLLPAGMCDRAVLVGDMTTARPGALHPAHTRQAHGGGQGPGAAIRPPSPRPTADAERPGPRRAEHGPPP